MTRGAAGVFTPTPDGLPGNDDLGALSGWLVWTMLGLYPTTPEAPVYTVASPVFESATLHTYGGDVTIAAPGASAVSKYVQHVRLGSSEHERAWVSEAELLRAGTFTLEMGPIPDVAWGSAPSQSPPSLSTDADLRVFGCRR